MAEAKSAAAKTAPKKTTSKAKADSGSKAAQDSVSEASKEAANDVKDHTAVARSKFNAAIDQAREGAAAMREGTREAMNEYRELAKDRSADLAADAKAYGQKVQERSGELATEGKNKTGAALRSVAKYAEDSAALLDERFGSTYGDYARSASKGLKNAGEHLENRSVEELGEDAREVVRKNPGVSIGIAALAGFVIARIFSGGRR